jgi:YggT family protein
VDVVCLLLNLYVLILLASIVLSWFPGEPGGALASVRNGLWRLTEPVLGPIRRAIPAVRLGAVGFDLSPLIVLIGIQIIRSFIC